MPIIYFDILTKGFPIVAEDDLFVLIGEMCFLSFAWIYHFYIVYERIITYRAN